MEKHEEMGSEVAAQNEANQELLEEQVENDLTTALDRKDRDAVTTLLEEAHPIETLPLPLKRSLTATSSF